MTNPASTRTYIFLGSTLALAAGAAAFKQMRGPFFTTAALATSSVSPNPSSPALSPEEAKTAKIWNRFADGYSKSKISDEVSYQKKLEITREYLSPSSKLLEFGCGTGGTAILHAPYVKHIHAVDVSSRMIEIAREKADSAEVENVDFEATGVDSLDVPDGSYDVVLGLSILHLLPNKDEVVRKVHRLLKPEGYFVSSTICMGDFAKYIGWLSAPFARLGIIPKLNVFTKEELRKSLEDSGFEIEREFHPGKDKAVFLVAKKK